MFLRVFEVIKLSKTFENLTIMTHEENNTQKYDANLSHNIFNKGAGFIIHCFASTVPVYYT
jgi:hypothetical protein